MRTVEELEESGEFDDVDSLAREYARQALIALREHCGKVSVMNYNYVATAADMEKSILSIDIEQFLK